ncbi:MAG: AAA family ATPase [Bacteroidales bacterium]|nr:AAA family ATPase [Bacteroidales bacterium]
MMLEWCKNNFPNHPIMSLRSSKEISFELEDGKIYAIASSGNKYPVNDDRIIFFLQTQEYNPGETYPPTIGKYILDNYSDDNEKSPYVFIIDEINRGEMSKIFGELFFSIDPGYRGTAGRVKTQYQKLVKEKDVFYDGFYVPENVYIIGTMNDIDRSVESMDFAFRRRFAFKEVTAKESQQMLYSEPALSEKVDEIIGRMNALNEAICPKDKNNSDKKGIDGLSSAYHIGASYFLKLANYKKDDGTFEYEKLWDYHLKRLLFEYLRGMPDAEEKLDALRKAFEKSDSNPS